MASREEKKREIQELLKDQTVETIFLTGEAGVGKTWIAEQMSDFASSKGLSYMTFWVFLNQQPESMSFYRGNSLYENFARQLSLLPDFEDWEEDNVSKEEKPKEKGEKTEEEKRLEMERLISNALKEKRSATPDDKKFLLLILDGVPDDTRKEDDILQYIKATLLPDIKAALQLNEESTPYKVLITRRNEPVKEASDQNKETNEVTAETNQSKATKRSVIIEKIEPLTEEERLTLLMERVNEKVKKIADFEKFAGEIAKKSKGLPAAIVVIIAKALNRIGGQDSKTLTLEGALKEAADDVNPLLPFAYAMLQMSDMVLINSCCQSRRLFLKHERVHYHELIAFWILEGCVGAFDRVEQAYEEGHRVLMELVDLHMLKIPYDNIVVMDKLAHTVLPDDCGRDGYGGSTTSSLGLASVLEGSDWQGFRRITQAGGMIKTPSNMEASPIEARWKKVCTLLIDGRRLYREVPDIFFKPMQGLQVLVIFNPTFRSLPSSLSKMDELRLLVLRGCDPLENIDPIKELKSLIVLEISGAASLKNIPDDFFQKLSKLRSLKLSVDQITSLPSISHLSELRWLILSGCSSLKKLPKIKTLTKLELIDLSGATELETLEGRAWVELVNLRMLDVSRTKISRLPILGDKLGILTTLSLSGCKRLARLPKLKGLSNLQFLDLSGAVMLKEFPDDSLQVDSKLKILHLSQTLIPNLPSNFYRLSNLELLDLSGAPNLGKLDDNCFQNLSKCRHLDLSNTNIENLPSISKLGNLEVLNLSGCRALTNIGDDQCFEQMTRLQCLGLCEISKIERLPSLSKLVNLRQLLLKNSTGLKDLHSLESMSKLEQLDLSVDEPGARFPEGTTADFLNNMIQLQLLNLSWTGLKISSLSNLTNLTNLTQLSLGGCSLLESEPNFGNHTKLEVLDLSEPKITSLPSLGKLSSLRELKLRGCSGLEQLPDLKLLVHLEVLDLWGTGIKGFPYEISELTSLKHLDLPDMTHIPKVDWVLINRLPEEVNWVECDILKQYRDGPCISLSATELSTILKGYLKLVDLGKFHISVSPDIKKQRSGGDIIWHRVDRSLRDIYLKLLSIPEDHGGFLEIVGFESFPAGIEGAIVKAEYISLIDSKFVKSLSDLAAGLKAVNEGVTAMKGCMVERCTEMETIFGGEETEVKMRDNLEILRATNLPKLKSVVSVGNVEHGGFQKLTELYLDCCPALEIVFPSSQLPENLKILEIKFCDKLKTLFNPEAETKGKQQKLEKLHLVELPELTSIGVPPVTKLVKLRNCPQMHHLEEFTEITIQRY
ncbi:putative disease resistance protein At4g19050 [Alnus glutinosa]|uniref:putative disease resistance protein At4g19050 n=1 Tax=Alnus glutinosa TaxID=3517 RepID=UPI002D79334D|nr:putative disease resistance protein At4g19050 [Alnus glutinosa]